MSHVAPAPSASPRPSRWKHFSRILGWGGAIGLVSAATIVPYPYVIESPGPTYNVLGQAEGQEIIDIQGHPTYPAGGSLKMTTVSVLGGPGQDVSGLEIVRAWLSGSSRITPTKDLYPSDVTREQVQSSNALQMSASQNAAIAAALTHEKIPFTSQLAVMGVSSGGASDGILKPEDLILAAGGSPVKDAPALRAKIAESKGAPVELRISRGGTETTVTVTPRKSGDAWLLGIMLTPKYAFPFTPSFHLDGVGGPSAGLMFTLGLVEELTPGEMTGGKSFAGTGTIDAAGTVGPIGGIQQKMIAARRDGADYFLAPAENCGDVVGHVPDGLTVIRVANLTEAITSVTAVGSGATPQSDPSAFRTCS
jgi:PDZ domain-containing protein